MSRPFQFKQFQITQEANAQKIGSDTMLLGSWITGTYKHILDIGTGTGILALMCAQKFNTARITAIEPHKASLEEAAQNFKASPFSNRLLPIQTALQNFGSIDPFDLIITNPPYFETSYLSGDSDRNRTRHTDGLPIYELYEYAISLIAEDGTLAVVLPTDIEERHLRYAQQEGFFPKKILRTIRPNGTFKRSLIQFTLHEQHVAEETLMVKDQYNQYSDAYIELTRDFYKKDLSKR